MTSRAARTCEPSSHRTSARHTGYVSGQTPLSHTTLELARHVKWISGRPTCERLNYETMPPSNQKANEPARHFGCVSGRTKIVPYNPCTIPPSNHVSLEPNGQRTGARHIGCVSGRTYFEPDENPLQSQSLSSVERCFDRSTVRSNFVVTLLRRSPLRHLLSTSLDFAFMAIDCRFVSVEFG